MTETAEAAAGVPSAVPEGFSLRREGQATILQQGNDVFFNPAQVVNRDLSVLVLQQFQQIRKQEGSLKAPGRKSKSQLDAAQQAKAQPDGLRILEGLAASGLRSFRYALECEGIRQVDANDMDADAVANIRQNCAWNPSVAGKVHATQSDARILMMQNEQVYDVVDLDPYGSPNTLLDGAVQAVSEGGLLMITATDMAVLCGNSSEACWAKYGSYPVHRPYCHEMALRILLACLEVRWDAAMVKANFFGETAFLEACNDVLSKYP